MYKLEYSTTDGKVGSIRRLHDNASIPIAEGNSDYQEFKKWNAEQSVKLNLASVNQDIILANATLEAEKAKKEQDKLLIIDEKEIDKLKDIDEIKVYLKKLVKIIC